MESTERSIDTYSAIHRATKEGPMPSLDRRTVGYVRVSTEDQADSGLSVDVQTRKIRAMLALRDCPESRFDLLVDLAASGRTLDRPHMANLIKNIRAGKVETVIVSKLDRLTRSVRDLADLIDLFTEHDTSLVSVQETVDTGTAIGRLLLNIIGSVAQWERETIVERTKEALNAKKASGFRAGNCPFGYTAGEDGRLIPDPKEREALMFMRVGREQGLSLKGIAELLTEHGHLTRRGNPFTRQGISALLNKEK